MRSSIFMIIFTAIMFALPLDAMANFATDWQLGFQEAITPVMTKINEFHEFLLIICVAVSAFVGFLILYICTRFRASANPKPSKTTHNTTLEIIWTTIPVIILVLIAIPSFRLLAFQDKLQDADMTVKVVGYQWYWGYEYPDHGGIKFDSYLLEGDDLPKDGKRLLEVDNRLVVPVDTNIRVHVTSADVIHSWFMPAMGMQIYAIPGRLNETWFRAEKTGVYYGQCNQICGIRHGFMPVVIEVVSKAKFKEWVSKAKDKYADSGNLKFSSIAK